MNRDLLEDTIKELAQSYSLQESVVWDQYTQQLNRLSSNLRRDNEYLEATALANITYHFAMLDVDKPRMKK